MAQSSHLYTFESSKSRDAIDLTTVLCQKVYTSDREAVTFEDVLTARPEPPCSVSTVPQPRQVLVIFIRHFFCGNCQEYLRRVTTSFPSPLPSHLSIAIIGCGSPSLIDSYRSLITTLPALWPIYADPTTELYRVLGTQRSLSLGARPPEYIQHSLISGVIKSVVQGVKRIPQGDAHKAGDLSINGGEYLFELQTDHERSHWNLIWNHIMMNSRDHIEVNELAKIVGVSTEVKNSEVGKVPITLSAPISAQAVSAAQTSRERKFREPYEEVVAKLGASPRTPVSTKRRSWMQRLSTYAEISILGRSAGPPPT